MCTNTRSKVGVVGAGAIAQAVAILLNERGHDTIIWPPSGKVIPKEITVDGVVESHSYQPKVALNPSKLAEHVDVIIFALPANGYKSTMDAVAPYVTEDQHVIISSHMSFAAVYLKQILAARQIDIPITAWSTTAVTAKQVNPKTLNVSSIRETVEIVAIPSSRIEESLATCRALFPNIFLSKRHILDITLSNLNPQVHMGMALCNLTRMEQQEEWCQRKNVTPTVGRLIEALDAERIYIANAYGCSVKPMIDSNVDSEGDKKTLSDINQILHLKRCVWGPKTVQSRYVLEDVPYGLVVLVRLARLANIQAPLHESGITLLSALYGRDFDCENEILDEIDLNTLL